MIILLIEPVWDQFVHLPANLGALLAVRNAYPDAVIFFSGGTQQIEEMKKLGAPAALSSIKFLINSPFPDLDTGYAQYRTRRQVFEGILSQVGKAPDFILLCSCVPTALAAISSLGLAGNSAAFLHGNANELSGWRSRHPVRRYFDLTSSMKRFAREGGRVLVYEGRIREALGKEYPWLRRALRVVPHPILESEAGSRSSFQVLEEGQHLKIGFAGLATRAKGFPEFAQLAKKCKDLGMPYEFHSIGPLHPECKDVDQTALVCKAGRTLERNEYVSLLQGIDFLFAWHKDVFYSMAASGIVYDAINLEIPILGRTGGLLSQLDLGGSQIGENFDTIADVVDYLRDRKRFMRERITFIRHLADVRDRHTFLKVGVAIKEAILQK